jgi:hypothetical protein
VTPRHYDQNEEKHRRRMREKLRRWCAYLDRKAAEEEEKNSYKRLHEELMDECRERGWG